MSTIQWLATWSQRRISNEWPWNFFLYFVSRFSFISLRRGGCKLIVRSNVSRHSFVIGIAAECSLFCFLRNYLSERAHRQCFSANFRSYNLNAWFRYCIILTCKRFVWNRAATKKKYEECKSNVNASIWNIHVSNLGIISTHSVVLANFEFDFIHIGSFQTCRRRLSTQQKHFPIPIPRVVARSMLCKIWSHFNSHAAAGVG